MSLTAGLSIAYLKIIFLAMVIMLFVWAVVKVWLAFYQKYLTAPIVDGVDDKANCKFSASTD